MLTKNTLFFFFIIYCIITSFNTICHGGVHVKYTNITDVPPEKWEKLANKKIYFGHQSVGYNIIDGIEKVMAQHPEIKLNIQETRELGKETGILAHSRIGENTKPETKITDFVKAIHQNSDVLLDASALKFCYVDVNEKMDMKELFNNYQKAMKLLQLKHPNLKILHFTMPLRTQKINWKTQLKLVLGKNMWEFVENIKRNEYNKLLLSEYKDKEPVFDLALFEATAPNGKVEIFKYKGKSYLAMNPLYTSDGGHLNLYGSEMIAKHFLLFLVNEL